MRNKFKMLALAVALVPMMSLAATATTTTTTTTTAAAAQQTKVFKTSFRVRLTKADATSTSIRVNHKKVTLTAPQGKTLGTLAAKDTLTGSDGKSYVVTAVKKRGPRHMRVYIQSA